MKAQRSYEYTFIFGYYAPGRDSRLIDLVLVGRIERTWLEHLTIKSEALVKRKIRALILSKSECEGLKSVFSCEIFVLLWDIVSDRGASSCCL